MTVGGLADTVFCFSRPCACHLYTAPRNNIFEIVNPDRSKWLLGRLPMWKS
jgi:hypothetical protein